ncbi:hypothetical protein CF319_g5097 [Tilletia indica]|nr:hypothetical protein CF319_g5097 [Tilletia indica]
MKFLRTKYAQSKHDTSALANWLARAAVEHGFPISNFSPSVQHLLLGQDDPGRERTKQQLKNAAKKKKQRAKRQAPAKEGEQEDVDDEENGSGSTQQKTTTLDPPKLSVPTSATSDIPTGDYVVQAHQFIEIAKFLAEKKVNIPLELLQLLRRCIGLRLHTLKRFLSAPDYSTFTHKHFINVLREVGNILHDAREEALAKKLSKINKTRKAGTDKQDMPSQNRFGSLADLEVELEDDRSGEELSDIPLEQARREPGASVSAAKARFAPSETKEELLMAVLFFLADLHDIRKYILELWMDYNNGKVDLITASVTTNTALELIRKPEHKLMLRVLPHFRYKFEYLWPAIIDMVHSGQCTDTHAETILYSATVSDSDTARHALYDHFFVPAFEMLRTDPDPESRHIPADMYDSRLEDIDSPVDPYQLPVQQRWELTRNLIDDVYIQYMLINMGSYDGYEGADMTMEYDELAKTWASDALNEHTSLASVFCAQIFVDINFTLRNTVQRCAADLRVAAARMKASMEARAQIEPGPTNWGVDAADQEEKARLFLRDLTHRATEDDVINVYYRHFIYRDFSLAVANNWDTLYFSGHLYHLCQLLYGNDPDLRPEWRDVDLLFDLVGKENFFGGRIPETAQDSRVNLLQAMNANAATLHAVRTGTRVEPGANRYRPKRKGRDRQHLKPKAQIMEIYRSRFVGSDEVTYIDLSSIEALIEETAVKESQKISKLRRERSHRTPKFSIPQLLAVLENSLENESASIRFDFLRLHLTSFRALDSVHAVIEREMNAFAPPTFLAPVAFYAGIVGFLIKAAAGLEQSNERRLELGGAAARQLHGRDPVMVRAAAALTQFLRDQDQGRVELNTLVDERVGIQTRSFRDLLELRNKLDKDKIIKERAELEQ